MPVGTEARCGRQHLPGAGLDSPGKGGGTAPHPHRAVSGHSLAALAPCSSGRVSNPLVVLLSEQQGYDARPPHGRSWVR